MKKIIYILTILFPLVLISCASTPIRDVKVPDLYKIDLPQEEQVPIQMDFIGYKSNINLLSVAMGNTTKDSVLMDYPDVVQFFWLHLQFLRHMPLFHYSAHKQQASSHRPSFHNVLGI